MKRIQLRLLGLVCSVLLLSACFAPKTPQEVSEAFWESVINNDAEDAVEYSTLSDVNDYDAFSKDWAGFSPTWGKVVIEENEASIVSVFSKPGESEDREFVTYLVRRNEEWKVDYERTGDEVRGGVFANLFRTLGRIGDDIGEQFKRSAKDFDAEMERMSEQLEKLSDSVSEQASKTIKRHGEELRRSIEELEESINRALKELDRDLSDGDRRVLQEVAAELNENGSGLSDVSVESIAEGSKSIGKAHVKLGALDNKLFSEYKQQWRQWGDQFEDDMHRLLRDISP